MAERFAKVRDRDPHPGTAERLGETNVPKEKMGS
jgi:hypothetical protein